MAPQCLKFYLWFIGMRYRWKVRRWATQGLLLLMGCHDNDKDCGKCCLLLKELESLLKKKKNHNRSSSANSTDNKNGK